VGDDGGKRVTAMVGDGILFEIEILEAGGARQGIGDGLNTLVTNPGARSTGRAVRRAACGGSA